MDGVDDQGTLDTESRAIGTVNSFNFSIDQSIRGVVESCSSIVLEGATNESVVSHKFNDLPIIGLPLEVFDDSGHEMGLRELPGVVHDLSSRESTMSSSSVRRN